MAIWINGDPAEQIPVLDRGFQYGDGVFETIAVIDGEPLFWDSHMRRLSHAIKTLQLPAVPERLWQHDAQSAIDPAQPRQVLKLILSRGVGTRGYGTSGMEKATRVVYSSPWPYYPESHWRLGVTAQRCQTPLLGGAPFASLKSLNRLNQVVARQELSARVAEGLMCDSQGLLREGTFTNIFWVRAGRIETPILEQMGIAGVMRHEIMRWLAEQGETVALVDVESTVLADTSECFVSNSIIGIWPVQAVDGHVWAESPGFWSLRLMAWLRGKGLVSGHA